MNKVFNVQAKDLVRNEGKELYEYILNHNLNSDALIMEIKDDEGDRLLNLGKAIDSNNYLIKNDEQVNLKVIINSNEKEVNEVDSK